MPDHRRVITGFSNPTVKALRALREKKHRKAAGKFLAEGLRLLTDARECGHVPETLVLASTRDPHPLLAELPEGCTVRVAKGDNEAAGGSILGLMMLGAAKGDTIEIIVAGENAEGVMAELSAMVEDGFGEP